MLKGVHLINTGFGMIKLALAALSSNPVISSNADRFRYIQKDILEQVLYLIKIK